MRQYSKGLKLALEMIWKTHIVVDMKENCDEVFRSAMLNQFMGCLNREGQNLKTNNVNFYFSRGNTIMILFCYCSETLFICSALVTLSWL